MNTMKWAACSLIATALLGLTACSTTEGNEEVDAVETPDGAMIVDTFTTTATVTAINTADRKVTLKTPNGHKTTYKCGPEMVNFNQIAVGDVVKATVSEEVAIYIGQGAPPSAMAGAAVALAPVGAKPGGVMVATEQVTATVFTVDAKHRKVTLQFADGTTKTVKVGKQVNIANVKPGQDVTAQVSQGVALSVVKP